MTASDEQVSIFVGFVKKGGVLSPNPRKSEPQPKFIYVYIPALWLLYRQSDV